MSLHAYRQSAANRQTRAIIDPTSSVNTVSQIAAPMWTPTVAVIIMRTLNPKEIVLITVIDGRLSCGVAPVALSLKDDVKYFVCLPQHIVYGTPFLLCSCRTCVYACAYICCAYNSKMKLAVETVVMSMILD